MASENFKIYSNFFKVGMKIKSATTVKLLFWLVSNHTFKGNRIMMGKGTFIYFNEYLPKAISKRTYRECLKELVELKIFGINSSGYYFDAKMFWVGGMASRERFLINEKKMFSMLDGGKPKEIKE